MESHLSSPWNNAVAFLSMFYGEQQLATGSCFFWRHDERTYLLTNWHNLAGRNPLTAQPLSPTGGIPDRVRFMAYKPASAPDVDGYYNITYVPVEVTLCNCELTHPKWFEHPSSGRKVDVAALDVTEEIKGFQVETVNAIESDALHKLEASQDVFVIGFPFGLITNAPAPIWKRGTIALDPTYDPDGLPKMFIDTATREGMSGSVVVARHVNFGPYTTKDGSKSKTMLYFKHNLVIGIYSGRHYPDLEKAQLGIVWKRTAIEQTVEARRLVDI